MIHTLKADEKNKQDEAALISLTFIRNRNRKIVRAYISLQPLML